MLSLTRRWAIIAAAAVALVAAPIAAAATPSISDEVSGGSVAARAATTALKAGFDTAVGSVVAPLTITSAVGATISGVFATTTDGVTISVERARYTLDALAPTFVEYSTNPGTGTCGGSGQSMQGGAPRPSILTGAADCSDLGVVYNESGGAGESTTRDAVELTFSQPVNSFGAWFGDLETRTDGQGVPAIVFLYDDTDTLVEQFSVVPTGNQSGCSNAASLCGNNSTRWVGFTNQLVARMVVVVGDEDATGNASAEGISFIGPTALSPTVTIEAQINTSGIVAAVGDSVLVPVTVTNTGQSPLVLDDLGVDCDADQLAIGGDTTCYVPHIVTATDAANGGFDASLTATGSWYSLDASDTTTGFVPLTTIVVPLAPTVVAAEQCGQLGTVEIPVVAGVSYAQSIDGTVVTVTASAQTNYVVADGADAQWVLNIAGTSCPVVDPGDPVLPERPDPSAPELADTGVASATGGLIALASGLAAAGVILITRRRDA